MEQDALAVYFSCDSFVLLFALFKLSLLNGLFLVELVFLTGFRRFGRPTYTNLAE